MANPPDVFAKVRGHEREEQLRAAREADLLPYFRMVESPAAPVVEMEGAERIMLPNHRIRVSKHHGEIPFFRSSHLDRVITIHRGRSKHHGRGDSLRGKKPCEQQ
jgi:hypothetical protein